LFCHAQRYTGQGYWKKEREIFSEDYFVFENWKIGRLKNWRIGNFLG
jgi:hypothetical protein